MEVFECVSFIFVKDGQVLLEQRSKSKETDPGLIAIPGGHLEYGETQQQALLREIKEELDVVPNNATFLCSLYHPTIELQLLHYYVITEWEGSILSLEADAVAWYPIDNAPVATEADKLALLEIGRVSPYLYQS
ncbi:NUDIX hydrolase [Vibrio ziniensis]|uniref:8-oxo-dGTP diphosphatase n=1 Tax=Vibrio ziniensis TaxID=2711221 RepID=A0A6G7CII8_9VIBR|nr:NUDIX domain-containing protein [Vibrio ziniensis]QIH41925.1 NUDIX domain-containing protein [Vibrio ziniensis]